MTQNNTQPAVYDFKKGDVFVKYGIGIGAQEELGVIDKLDGSVLTTISWVHLGKHQYGPIYIIGDSEPEEKHLGVLLSDKSIIATASRVCEVFNVTDDLEYGLYNLHNILVIASQRELMDKQFEKLSKAIHFVPEYRYGSMEGGVDTVVEEAIKSYNDDWGKLMFESDFSRFVAGDKNERASETIRRLYIHTGASEKEAQEAADKYLQEIIRDDLAIKKLQKKKIRNKK